MSGPTRRRWVLATGNPGKVREFAAALAPAGLDLDAATDLGLGAFPPETGATYEENALLKAGFAAAKLGRVAVADDSGLEVDALGGGARRAGPRASAAPGSADGERTAHLLQRLKHVPVAAAPGALRVRRGRGRARRRGRDLRGTLRRARSCFGPRGDDGFGYDPVFRSASSA